MINHISSKEQGSFHISYRLFFFLSPSSLNTWGFFFLIEAANLSDFWDSFLLVCSCKECQSRKIKRIFQAMLLWRVVWCLVAHCVLVISSKLCLLWWLRLIDFGNDLSCFLVCVSFYLKTQECYEKKRRSLISVENKTMCYWYLKYYLKKKYFRSGALQLYRIVLT